MSRLRRRVLSDRFFFVTWRVHSLRRKLIEGELAVLAEMVRERREAHRCLWAAWLFLPDHGHAILFPRSPLTLSRVMGIEDELGYADQLINRINQVLSCLAPIR